MTDLDLAYRFNDHITLSLGATNLLDKYPEKQIASTVASVAAGTNGWLFREVLLWRRSTMVRMVMFKPRCRKFLAAIRYPE